MIERVGLPLVIIGLGLYIAASAMPPSDFVRGLMLGLLAWFVVDMLQSAGWIT